MSKKDGRVKLTAKQRLAISSNLGDLTQQELADKYGVSKRTVQFIQDPEKLEANRQAAKDRGGWRRYYDKDKHREATNRHRAAKKRKRVDLL